MFLIKNRDKYDGQFINGIKEGKGRLIFKNGEVYEGDFKDGLMHG